LMKQPYHRTGAIETFSGLNGFVLAGVNKRFQPQITSWNLIDDYLVKSPYFFLGFFSCRLVNPFSGLRGSVATN